MLQFLDCQGIPFDILLEFFLPPFCSGFGDIGEAATFVMMKETAMNEDGTSPSGKDYVRFPWQILTVQPKAVPMPVQPAPDDHLGFSVL